jgi:hypothetical protein
VFELFDGGGLRRFGDVAAAHADAQRRGRRLDGRGRSGGFPALERQAYFGEGADLGDEQAQGLPVRAVGPRRAEGLPRRRAAADAQRRGVPALAGAERHDRGDAFAAGEGREVLDDDRARGCRRRGWLLRRRWFLRRGRRREQREAGEQEP